LGGIDNTETGPRQHAGYATPEPKKRPPHWREGPIMASKAAKMACRGGRGLGPPNPGHEAASEEAKAIASKTPPQSTGLVNNPLMEGQEEGTKT